jgi:hypothetical protein
MMSDVSQGPGWWLASDGKWYPPEQAPGTPGYGRSDHGEAGDGPSAADPVYVYLTGNPPIANWRAFLHFFMAIPHYIINYLLSYLRAILAFFSFFTVLFARKVLPGVRDIQMMTLRYNNRFVSFAALLHDTYPPFDFTSTPTDPGGYPLVTSFHPLDELDRWRCLQPLLLIPQAIVLVFVILAAFFAYIAGWFAVLFTGRQPDGISEFLVGVGRWTTRVSAYGAYLSDQYPPFSLR